MSNLSLLSSIKTCDVNSGYAQRLHSDRFLNANNTVCPTFNGFDLAGREVCPDSFFLMNREAGGCFSATNRVSVENEHRPRYSAYVTLNMSGIDDAAAPNSYANTGVNQTLQQRRQMLDNLDQVGGNFGLQRGASRQSSCGHYPQAEFEAIRAQNNRNNQNLNQGYKDQARTSSCS